MYTTFIILKPETLDKGLVGPVMKRFREAGLSVQFFDYVRVTEDRITKHYAELIEREGGSFHERVIRSYVGRYVIPMILSGESETIISDVRRIAGATDPARADRGTIRGDLATDTLERAISEDRLCENLIHASDSQESREREINLWIS